MSETRLTIRKNGAIAYAIFSSDSGVNVLSSSVLSRIDATMRELAEQRDIRVCIFGAEGKVFLAGADIKEMAAYDPSEARGYGRLGLDAFDSIEALPCVTIAAIHGAALGGGLELALACDFRVAVRSARVGLPEVTLGLIPGWKGTRRLPSLIGPARSKRLILSGEAIKAEEAAAIGLVDELVNSHEDLMPRAEAMARSFMAAGPQAIALAKRAMRDGHDLSAFADCFHEGADGHEGMKAFLEKRKARWVVSS